MNPAAHHPNSPYEPLRLSADHVDLGGILELLLWAGGLLAVVVVVPLLL